MVFLYSTQYLNGIVYVLKIQLFFFSAIFPVLGPIPLTLTSGVFKIPIGDLLTKLLIWKGGGEGLGRREEGWVGRWPKQCIHM
jgi:hypothetical protein